MCLANSCISAARTALLHGRLANYKALQQDEYIIGTPHSGTSSLLSSSLLSSLLSSSLLSIQIPNFQKFLSTNIASPTSAKKYCQRKVLIFRGPLELKSPNFRGKIDKYLNWWLLFLYLLFIKIFPQGQDVNFEWKKKYLCASKSFVCNKCVMFLVRDEQTF